MRACSTPLSAGSSEIIHVGCEDEPSSSYFPPSHICHVRELHSHGLKQILKTAPVLIWGLWKAEPELRSWGDPRRQESEAGEEEEEQWGCLSMPWVREGWNSGNIGNSSQNCLPKGQRREHLPTGSCRPLQKAMLGTWLQEALGRSPKADRHLLEVVHLSM